MRCYSCFSGAIATAMFSLTLLPLDAKVNANEIYSPVLFPVTPAETDLVPNVQRVPGKDYTDSLDMTHTTTPHSVRPSQLGQWDGIGGARDGQWLAQGNTQFFEFNVDAQSQVSDVLFDGVINNRNPLIVSTSSDGMLGNDTALVAERTSGSAETFATRKQVVDHPHVGGLLRDIDSVDLWGTEDPDGHAGFYSFGSDPNNTSVYYNFLGGVPNVQPYLSKNDIANAIGDPNIAPQIDVDGLMVRDIGTGFNPFDGEFNTGDAIMFSIAPVVDAAGTVRYDGGEIWVWEHGQPAQFLKHGGHTWDTAFDVAGLLRVNTENIDALEAVGAIPEPGSLALLVGGVVATIATRRRVI